MKNIFKIVIAALFITILSGCTLEENITIENSGATDEKTKIYTLNKSTKDIITPYGAIAIKKAC